MTNQNTQQTPITWVTPNTSSSNQNRAVTSKQQNVSAAPGQGQSKSTDAQQLKSKAPINRSKWHCYSCGALGHIARECGGYRKSLCKLGYGPSPGLTDPDELDKHYAMAVKLAPTHCFHCMELGHMKPACPLLNLENSGKLGVTQPPPKQINSQAQSEGSENKMSAMESRIEQRLERQMDEIEKRMLDAINNLNRPRAVQNSHNNSRPNQAKAVRTPDETVDDVNFDESRDCSATKEEVSRQDQVKILKLADRKQLSLLECGGHQVTKELECESNQSVVHLDVYTDYLRQKGQDIDKKA